MSADRTVSMPRAAQGGAAVDRHDVRRRIWAIVGGSSGNLVEWYDFYVYSFTALYFSGQFFPKGDQTAQLLQAAAIFAVGFLARPIGAWAMGVYADRIGRRAALALAVALMSLGSFAIAFIPSSAARFDSSSQPRASSARKPVPHDEASVRISSPRSP